MLEEALYGLLNPLVAGGAAPDVTDDNPVFPCITYQQIGGQAYAYAEKRLPDYRHARALWILPTGSPASSGRSIPGLLRVGMTTPECRKARPGSMP